MSQKHIADMLSQKNAAQAIRSESIVDVASFKHLPPSVDKNLTPGAKAAKFAVKKKVDANEFDLNGNASTASADEPILLAQAEAVTATDASAAGASSSSAATGVATGAETGAAAGAGSAAGAAAGGGTALSIGTMSVIGVGAAAAVAVAASGGGGAAAVAAPVADTTAPLAATSAATAGAGPLINATEATAGVAVVATLAGTSAVAGDTIELKLGGASFATPLTHVLTAGEVTAGSYIFTIVSGTLGADGVKSLTTVVTDAAGNVGTASPALALTLDTATPAIQSMTAAGSTVVLTYNEALDAVNVPATGAFAVTVGGVANVVTGVVVAGMTVTLTLTSAVATGAAVQVIYTDPTAGNDVNAIQDSAGNDAVSFTTGVAADGYIRGAQIYIDTNSNGVADAGELLTGVVTNANGNFILPAGTPTGAVIATGGVNIDTGVANTLVLKAPAGSTVITPLTTLVQAYIAQNAGTTVADASATIVASLGLAAGTNLTTYDPLAALAINVNDAPALAVQKAAVQVATVVALAAAAPVVGTTSADAATTVFTNLVTQMGTVALPVAINLTDATPGGIIETALGTVSSAVPATITTATTAISVAATPTAISTAQSVALDTVAPVAPTTVALTAASDTGSSATDTITNDTTPTVRVSLNTTATDGTAVVIGNTVTVLNSIATQVGTATLTSTDIANGYVDITVASALVDDGAHAFTATITDAASLTSTASTALNITLDTIVVAPTVALSTDSGGADGITNSGTLNVTNVEIGATVQYSVDGGTTWATTFTAAQGANSVQVRQTDVAGNVSMATTLAFTLDTVAVAPAVALTTDSGVAADLISNVGTLNVTGIENGATVQYSVDGGTTWATTFTAAQGANSVQVRQTDVAGNVSTATTLAFTLDTVAVAPTVALTTDSGVVADLISNVGALTVGAEAGAAKQYSINAGTTWTNSFTAVEGLNAVEVRQTDVAGNLSAATTLAFTLDTVAPIAPTVALTTDSGVVADLISNVGTLNVTGTENGATVQYSVDGGTTWATTFMAAQGANSVQVRQTDVAGNPSATTTLAFALDAANPVFTSLAAANFAENGTGAAYTAAAMDAHLLTYTLSGTDAALFNIDSGTGVVAFKNAPNYEAPGSAANSNAYSIDVTATDAAGNFSTQAVVLNVTNVNEAPTLTSGATSTATIAVNQAFSTNVSGLFTDVDAGNVFSYSATGLPAGITIDSTTGVISGTPTATGTVPIVITATDSGGLAISHTVTVSVVTAPVIASIVSNVAQAQSGDVLTFAVTTSEAVTVTGTPTLTLDVGGTAMTATYAGGTGTTSLTFTATTSAGDSSAVTVTAINLTAGATITGITTTQSLVTTVTGQVVSAFVVDNSNPIFTSAITANAAENQTAAYTSAATDVTALTYSLAGTDASLFNISASTGAVSFAAAPNFEAPADAGANNVYNVTVTATDALAHATNQAVAITVTNVNEAPALTSGATSTAIIAVNQAFSTNVSGLFTDVDAGNVFSYSATGLPAGITIDSTTGVISGTPTATGTVPIVITATDSGGLAISHTVTVSVVTAPVIASIVSNVAQAQSGDVLTFAVTTSEAVTVTGTPTLTLDVGGTAMTATYAGGTGTTSLTFTATTSAGDSSAVTVTAINLTAGATITGITTTQSLVTTVTGQVVSAFVVDNSNPIFTSAITANAAENQTAAYTSAATDVTALTYSLAGTDASLFNISASTGAVSFAAAPNFEAPADAGANNVYNVTVTATDALAHATNQAVAITVTNVNEAPALTSGATSTAIIAVNQAFSSNVSGLFADPDAGASLTYAASGLPSGVTIDPTTGVISGTPTTTGTANIVITTSDGTLTSASHTVTVTVVTAPTLTSTIDNVANFDVTSNIVLSVSSSVTAVASKYIHIINDGGTGFRGEATVNTQDILVTDTTQVTISNNTITINPGFDLDLSNNYHITVDAGAFVSGGVGSIAVSDAAAMNFSTVTPTDGLLGVANAVTNATSQAMDATGNLVASYSWMDIEGVGAPSSANGTARDLSTGNIAMVFKDYDTTTVAGGAQDGIGAPDLYVSATNFGAGDLLYVDNQLNTRPNDLAISSFFNDTPSNGVTQISFGTGVGGLGGLVEVTPVGAPTPSFVTALEFQTLLQTTYIPIISA